MVSRASNSWSSSAQAWSARSAALSGSVPGPPPPSTVDDFGRPSPTQSPLPADSRPNLGNPRLAWPAEVRTSLPGPLLYWSATVVLLVTTLAIVVVVFRLVSKSRVGTLPRRPLGVDARARFATARDLKPLVVRGRHPGRFLLGRHGRRLLATELPPTGRRRRKGRQGDRGAVALIGPSRSGKTTAAIAGILEWEGPAVLSSVKADLLASTCGWRKEKGKVLVYDPTHTTGDASAIWSPLRAAKTVLGAQRAARALCEAAPRSDNVKGSLDFWLAQAEILLSGLLWVAAHDKRDMARVCEWVMVQDRPREDGLGDVRVALNRLLESKDPIIQDGASRASQAVMSIWALEDETRSSVYATAQTVVWPWADPGVAAASRGKSLSLDWLLGGPNTLYLCAPIEDQERLSPAFGGLLNDLVKQVFLRVAATGRPLDPPLLIVIDEAGNTPLRSLPQLRLDAGRPRRTAGHDLAVHRPDRGRLPPPGRHHPHQPPVQGLLLGTVRPGRLPLHQPGPGRRGGRDPQPLRGRRLAQLAAAVDHPRAPRPAPHGPPDAAR